MDVDMESNDTVQEGHVLDLQHLDKAGLQPTDVYVRSNLISLWQVLTRSSCVVQGPPGVGKSTAVWFWLLKRLKALNSTSNCRVLWCHFHPAGFSTYLVISISPEEGLQFKMVELPNLLKKERFGICVLDGVREKNLERANDLCEILEYDKMVWVTSQKIVIPRENFHELGWKGFECSSWTREEIDSYAAVMREEKKAAVVADFKDVMAGRIDDRDYSMDEVVDIKHWFFGGSARYMFGMTMKEALADIKDSC